MNNAATITVDLNSIPVPDKVFHLLSEAPAVDSYLITTGSGAAWGSRTAFFKALLDAKTAQAWAHTTRNDGRPWKVEAQSYDLDQGKWVTLQNYKLGEFPSVDEARAFLKLG